MYAWHVRKTRQQGVSLRVDSAGPGGSKRDGKPLSGSEKSMTLSDLDFSGCYNEDGLSKERSSDGD